MGFKKNLLLATLAAWLSAGTSQAAKIIDPVFPLPGIKPPVEPSDPCRGSFYQSVAKDAQHDQIAGLPMHDFVEFFTSENPSYLDFSFYVTANPTIVPAQSRYEVRFQAGDSTDTYFVRLDSRGARDSLGVLIGDYAYGLYRGRSDGLGSQEIVSRKISDPGFFFAAGSGIEHPDVISFGMSKAELETLVPRMQGFDLGQKLTRLQAFSYSLASVASVADQTTAGSYRLRFDQSCRTR